MTVLAQEAADASADTETQKSDGGDVTVPVGQETGTESGDESGEEPPVTGGQDGVTEPAPDDGAGQETPEPGTEEKEPESVSGNGVESKPVAAPASVMMAAALQAENIASGNGWILDSDGRLTIESDIGMLDHTGMSGWAEYDDDIKSIVIQDGVTSIPDNAFWYYSNLESVELPGTVTRIGIGAFLNCERLKAIRIPHGVTSIERDTFYVFGNCKFVTDKAQGIHVPDADTYKNATDKGWGDWAPYITDGTHTHSWSTDWTNNEFHHWHECTVEGCTVTDDTDKDSYGAHVYDNDSDTDCNTCGYKRTASAHNAVLNVTLRVHGYDAARWKGINVYGHSSNIELLSISEPEIRSGQGYTDFGYTFNLNVKSSDNFFIKYSSYCIMIDSYEKGKVRAGQNDWGTVDVWPVRFMNGDEVLQKSGRRKRQNLSGTCRNLRTACVLS